MLEILMHLQGCVRLIILLAALCLSAVAATTPAGTRAASSSTRVYLPLMTQATAAVSIEQRLTDLTNELRRQQGCAVALVLSPQLSAAASAHSRDMALHDLFSHSGSDGSTMASRAVAAGYSYSRLAENLAAGQASPEEVVAGWMSSPGHRSNILNCALREIGVGYYEQSDDQSNVRLDTGEISGPYRHYWTQDLGAR
jgi:uncharacterized protein YkwD